MLAVVLVVLAATCVVLLVILEVMREVVILRGEIATVRSGLAGSMGPIPGQRIKLSSNLAPDPPWLMMLFLSANCSSCDPVVDEAASLVAETPTLATHLLVVERGGSDSGTGGRFGAASANRMVSPEIFDSLGVAATPTMVLLSAAQGWWSVEDVAIGPNTDWLRERLEDMTRRSLHAVVPADAG